MIPDSDERLIAQISREVKSLSKYSEGQLYYEISRYAVNEFKRQVEQDALESMDDKTRERAEEDIRTKDGLYGPISFLLGRVDDRMESILRGAAELQPSEKDGQGQFAGMWQRVKSKICEEWRYCDKRKEYADEMRMLIAIAAIIARVLSVDATVATAIALLATYKGPAFICNCPDKQVPTPSPS